MRYIMSIVPILLGVLIIISGFNNNKFLESIIENKGETEAIVTNSNLVVEEAIGSSMHNKKYDRYYKVYIEYTVEGIKYNKEFESKSKISKGEYIKIYYDTTDPHRYTRSIKTVPNIIYVIISIPFILLGIILFIKNK